MDRVRLLMNDGETRLFTNVKSMYIRDGVIVIYDGNSIERVDMDKVNEVRVDEA